MRKASEHENKRRAARPLIERLGAAGTAFAPLEELLNHRDGRATAAVGAEQTSAFKSRAPVSVRLRWVGSRPAAFPADHLRSGPAAFGQLQPRE
jgi:hypothetical protein